MPTRTVTSSKNAEESTQKAMTQAKAKNSSSESCSNLPIIFTGILSTVLATTCVILAIITCKLRNKVTSLSKADQVTAAIPIHVQQGTSSAPRGSSSALDIDYQTPADSRLSVANCNDGSKKTNRATSRGLGAVPGAIYADVQAESDAMAPRSKAAGKVDNLYSLAEAASSPKPLKHTSVEGEGRYALVNPTVKKEELSTPVASMERLGIYREPVKRKDRVTPEPSINKSISADCMEDENDEEEPPEVPKKCFMD